MGRGDGRVARAPRPISFLTCFELVRCTHHFLTARWPGLPLGSSPSHSCASDGPSMQKFAVRSSFHVWVPSCEDSIAKPPAGSLCRSLTVYPTCLLAFAEDATLSAAEDTTLFEGTDLGGAGGASVLYVGRLGTLGKGLKRRFLLKFDLEAASLQNCSNRVAEVREAECATMRPASSLLLVVTVATGGHRRTLICSVSSRPCSVAASMDRLSSISRPTG